MNYQGVGMIIENKNGDFLMHLRDGNTSRLPNQWGLVGGFIDEGEDALTAAVREVKEETNLTLMNPSIVDEFIFDANQNLVAIVKGDVDTSNEEVVLGEGAQLTFFSKTDAMNLIQSLGYTNQFLKAFSEYLHTTS